METRSGSAPHYSGQIEISDILGLARGRIASEEQASSLLLRSGHLGGASICVHQCASVAKTLVLPSLRAFCQQLSTNNPQPTFPLSSPARLVSSLA